MTYDLYDLIESLRIAQHETPHNLTRDDITAITYAFGAAGDLSEWMGGFVLQTNEHDHVLIAGWCDTTGWGCQDGVAVTAFDHEPTPDDLAAATPEWATTNEWAALVTQGDKHPIDLNRWLRHEIEE